MIESNTIILIGKSIGAGILVIVTGLLSYMYGTKKNSEIDENNPFVTEKRLLEFKEKIDTEYAKKEELICVENSFSQELSAVSGKLDKFLSDFNQFKLDIVTQFGSVNTSMAVMAEAMKHIPKRKED